MSYHLEILLGNLLKLAEKINERLATLSDGTGTAVGNSSIGANSALSVTQRKLTNKNLIALWNAIDKLEVPSERHCKKLHKAFVGKFEELLYYYQANGHSHVRESKGKALFDFVKNQRMNLWKLMDGTGPLARDKHYIKFLSYLGVTYTPTSS
jgi:hypothetical protein